MPRKVSFNNLYVILNFHTLHKFICTFKNLQSTFYKCITFLCIQNFNILNVSISVSSVVMVTPNVNFGSKCVSCLFDKSLKWCISTSYTERGGLQKGNLLEWFVCHLPICTAFALYLVNIWSDWLQKKLN